MYRIIVLQVNIENTMMRYCCSMYRKNVLQVNIENAMMRYEFLEAIVRAGIAKYGKGIATDDVAEAVRMLLANNIAPNLPPGAGLAKGGNSSA